MVREDQEVGCQKLRCDVSESDARGRERRANWVEWGLARGVLIVWCVRGECARLEARRVARIG